MDLKERLTLTPFLLMNHQQAEEFSLKEKPSQIVQVYSKKQSIDCFAIALNKEQTIMVGGYGDNKIIVFEFQQGALNQQQILSDHTSNCYIYTLYFMNKYNQFISGTKNEIGIWSYNDAIKQYYLLQLLKLAHKGAVNRVIMNKNEDLIISCSQDNTIKFWIKKNEWVYSQTLINHKDTVRDICLNESCTQLVFHVERITKYQQVNKEVIKDGENYKESYFKMLESEYAILMTI